jgi:hypothetical protein
VACLILAGIVAQPFLIGLYLFGAVHTSDLHTVVGYSLFEFGIPALLITALLARVPKRDLLLNVLLMADIFVQVLLVGLREESSVLAALHPLNAFALLLIAITVVRHERDLLLQTPRSDPQSVSSASTGSPM